MCSGSVLGERRLPRKRNAALAGRDRIVKRLDQGLAGRRLERANGQLDEVQHLRPPAYDGRMAGTFLQVSVDDRKLTAALERLAAVCARPREALVEIGEYLLESTEQRFSDQADPEGRPWAPLSPAYQARKKKRKDLILVLNGYLADFQAPQVSDDEVSVGTNLVYAATHQFGRPEANIPARPFLGLSDDDRAEILAILTEHIERAAGGAA